MCCLLFVVCRSLRGACCVLPDICRLSFVVRGSLLVAVCSYMMYAGLLVVWCCLLCVGCCMLIAMCCLLFAVWCVLFVVC